MLVDKGVQSHCQSINIVRPEEQAGHQVVVPAIDEGKNRNCRQSRQSQGQDNLIKRLKLGTAVYPGSFLQIRRDR